MRRVFCFPLFKFPEPQKESSSSRITVIQQNQTCHQQEVVQVLRKCTSHVSIFLEFLPQYKENIYRCISHFKAWCLFQHIFAWKAITSDQEVLQNIQRIKLEFEENPLHFGCLGFKIPKNQILVRLNKGLNKLLKKGVAVECENKAVEYISSIFLNEKISGT